MDTLKIFFYPITGHEIESKLIFGTRLENICKVEQLEFIRDKTLKLEEDEKFKEARKEIMNLKSQQSKNENYSFLNDGWEIEKSKILASKEKEQCKKQNNNQCSDFNKLKIAETAINKEKESVLKTTIVRERLDKEAQYAADIEKEKIENKNKKEIYFNSLSNQLDQERQYRKSRENYCNGQMATIKQHQKHLLTIDQRETQNPIDKRNPLLYI